MQKQFPKNAELFIDGLLINEQPVMSAITEIELLCWKTATANDIELLNSFINDALIIELEKPIKLKTVELRKTNKLKLPDAIIAATALVYNLVLITRKTADFNTITGLQVVNPWDK